ncbi:MAG: ABC transporter permease [Lachnospiraceae bacterium]|nr:ABC transporter permease [Lachnospiraceae bacterium]MCI9305225.1 ABC transporter permease [Lachnospiraceae bacterium]
MKRILKQFRGQTISIYIALIAVVILFSALSPTFFTASNIIIVLRQVSSLGIMALGMMYVMLLGNVDLSVGCEVSLLGIVMSYCMVEWGLNIPATIFICIALGLVLGLLNGFVVTYCKIPSIIATLGTSWIFQGISYTICNAQPIYGFPEGFSVLGQGSVGPIPIPIILFAFCALFTSFVLNKTVYGRTLYAVGSNEESARLSGVNTKFIQITSYVICSCFTILASVILLSRVNSGQPSTGIGQEMNVLTSIVLGGICFTGGDGQVSGSIAGVLVIGVLQNGLVMLGAGEYVQLMVKGLILLFALSIDSVKQFIKSRQRTAV